jgi:hypothetical protein
MVAREYWDSKWVGQDGQKMGGLRSEASRHEDEPDGDIKTEYQFVFRSSVVCWLVDYAQKKTKTSQRAITLPSPRGFNGFGPRSFRRLAGTQPVHSSCTPMAATSLVDAVRKSNHAP